MYIQYRPPGSSINLFTDELDNMIQYLSKEHKIIITGDFNINLINSDNHEPTANFVNTLMTNSSYPLLANQLE